VSRYSGPAPPGHCPGGVTQKSEKDTCYALSRDHIAQEAFETSMSRRSFGRIVVRSAESSKVRTKAGLINEGAKGRPGRLVWIPVSRGTAARARWASGTA
jgi:hypothetical protein